MKREKRRRQARVVLVVIIVVAVVVCYVLPLATLSAAAGEPPAPGTGDEFGTDDPSILPPEITAPPEEKPKQTVTIVNPPTILDIGFRGTLTCVIENAPEGTYPEWSSSNSSVIIVDDAGTIEAIAPGDAEIMVRAGTIRTSVYIHVNELKANRISIAVSGIEPEQSITGRTTYKISVSDVVQLRYNIEPKGAKVNSIAWSVSDTEIAEISQDISSNGEVIASASGQFSVTVTAGGLSDTIYFEVEESGVPMETILKYVILAVVAIVVIVVVATLIARAVRIQKEEERKKAIAARRKKEAARQRAEEARKRAIDEAEMAALVERNKQVLDKETTAHRSAKVSGATVSAIGDANKPNSDGEERPLTLDDIK